jgi:DNA helicase II / ATP-dependent DNA helicase PcrA
MMNEVAQQQIQNQKSSNDGLNSQQKEAVEYNGGHLLIVAGPGTGKTHTITQKIFTLLDQKNIPPDQIIALTFTRKAGEQLLQRLKKLLPDAVRLPFAGTFHSYCLQILHAHWKKEFRILSQKEQKEIFESVEEKQDQYEQRLNELNALDFDGILQKTVELIQGNSELQQQLHNHIRYLFVDEYQDVNEAQYLLIKQLTGAHTVLCAIGDPDQAIYSFRGADVQHFLRFEKDFPGTKILNLEQNYRSTKNIVNCANILIKNNTLRVHKNLQSIGEQGPRVAYIRCQTALSEAIWIAKEITKLVGGTDMSSMDQKAGAEYENHYHFADIAIIYRTNNQGRLLETAIKKEGLPYQRLAATPWYHEEEITMVLQHLQRTCEPQNISEQYVGFYQQYQDLHNQLADQNPL